METSVPLFVYDELLADPAHRRPAAARRELQQAKQDLSGNEGIAARGVAIVRDHVEHLAQCVQREVPNRGAPCEGAVLFEMQSQIHRVDAAVQQMHSPVTLAGRIEGGDVVTDVMAHDDPVADVVEKPFQCLRFLDAAAAFVARHAVHRNRARVLVNSEQRVEGVVEPDLTGAYGDGSDRDQPIVARIQAGRFGVEHDEANLIDRSVIGPGGLELLAVASDERRLHQISSSHFGSAVNSSSRWMAGKPLFRTCRSWRLRSAGGSIVPLVPWLMPTRPCCQSTMRSVSAASRKISSCDGSIRRATANRSSVDVPITSRAAMPSTRPRSTSGRSALCSSRKTVVCSPLCSITASR